MHVSLVSFWIQISGRCAACDTRRTTSEAEESHIYPIQMHSQNNFYDTRCIQTVLCFPFITSCGEKMTTIAKKKFLPKTLVMVAKNCCLSCGSHFKLGKVKVVFRDVVECTRCGAIWILIDLAEYNRWT